MRGEIVDRGKIDLQRNPEIISPPSLTKPIVECQTRVHVKAFLSRADVEVRVRDSNGVLITEVAANGGWPEPNGLLIDVGFELEVDMLVDARQSHEGRESDYSPAIRVMAFDEAFSLGLPRPVIAPSPTLDCGVRVGVGNLPVDFKVKVENSNHGSVGSGIVYRDGICGFNVSPANTIDDVITATASFCGRETEISEAVVTQVAPSPLLAPTIHGAVENTGQLRLGNIANGAMVHVSVAGSALGSWPCFGGSITIDLPSPLAPAADVEATQSLCADQPASPPGKVIAQSCSAVPAPIPESAQAGDMSINITNPQPGGTVEVYANLMKIGENGGSVIGLTRPLRGDDNLVLIGRVGECVASQAWSIDVHCVDPPVVTNPADLNIFPVGFVEVGDDSLRVDLGNPADPAYANVRIKGLLYYPGATDGEGVSTNGSVGNGNAPFVLIIHGRHRAASPSYLGYKPLQRTLARQGMVSLSVDHQDLQVPDEITNILSRARLGVFAMAYLAGDLVTLGPEFAAPPEASLIDFDRTGVMGHSRGGDAAVLLQHIVPSGTFTTVRPGTVRAVFPLAPTTFGTVNGSFDFRPTDVDTLVLLPALDADLDGNPGQKHYDLSKAARLRTQLLVDDTNHNRYNTVWWDDHVSGAQTEDFTGPTLMNVHEHQRIEISYGAALFQRSLLGINSAERILLGLGRPAGIPTNKLHLCHSLTGQVLVDSFEDADLTQNDLGGPNNAMGGFNAELLPRVDDPILSPAMPRSAYWGETGRMRAFSTSPMADRFEFNIGREFPAEVEIWIRVAEDHLLNRQRVSDEPLEFFVGILTELGEVWISSDHVGGLIPVVDGPEKVHSVFTTLRFPLSCFTREDRLEVGVVWLRTNWVGAERRYVFDDLEFVDVSPIVEVTP